MTSIAEPPVIHVVPYYPPHIGGMETVAGVIAEGLARHREVLVLTSSSGPAASRVERRGSLTIRRLFTVELAHLPFMPTLLGHLLGIPRLAVVHVHIAQAFVPEMVWLAGLLRRRPYLVHFHLDVEPSGPLGWIFVAYKRHILGLILRAAAAVIIVSPDQLDFLASTYRVAPGRIELIPNGVGPEFYREPRMSPGHEGPFRLLFVGRLAPQKNVALLLRAIAAVSVPVEVVIVGDGEERCTLERLRADLGLDHVRMVGAQVGPDLVDWYRWADAFILTSDRESTGLVLLEAMASGLPVIAGRVQGVTDTVGEDGILVEPEPVALADAIERLVADPALWQDLAHRGYERATQLPWTALIERLEDLYRRVEPHDDPPRFRRTRLLTKALSLAEASPPLLVATRLLGRGAGLPFEPLRRWRSQRRLAEVCKVIPEILTEIGVTSVSGQGSATVVSAAWSGTGVAVAKVGAASGEGSMVVKLPSRSGAAGLHRAAEVMRGLRADPRLKDFVRLVPTPLGDGQVGGQVYAVERALPGVDARLLLARAETRATILRGAAVAIGELHRRTSRAVTVDAAARRAWVDRPAELVAQVSRDPRRVAALAGDIGAAWEGRRVVVSWVHGDYWPGNLLVTPDTAAVAGIVDWEWATPDGLAQHDLLHLLVYARALAQGVEMGTVVRALLDGSRWDPTEQGILDAVGMFGPVADRTTLLLFWLRHVSLTLVQSAHFSRDWIWIARNVDQVLAGC